MAAKSKSGGNTLTGTAGNDHLNGGAGADDIRGLGGDDRIGGGSGNDVLDGGAGNDIVSGDSGDDLLIYNMSENTGSTDTYDGGSGHDTLQLVLTRAEWQSPAVQADIARFLVFLAEVTHPVNGQANNRNFTFSSGLTVSKFESLSVIVDGVAIDPRDEAVTLVDDAMIAGEETASISVDVLANDSVPDLIASLTNTQPAHGSVVLTQTFGAPGTPDTASFVYTPDADHWQYLAAGETATDTFTYTVTDSDGDVQTATVTVTITGSNDAPTLGAVVSEGAVVEDGASSASGAIAFADVDLSDSHSVTSQANGAGFLGVFSAVVADASTGDGEGSVTWDFSVDNAAIQYLAAGETLTQSYTVTVDDGNGGTVDQIVTVTLTGTNDAPTITSATSSGAVVEDGVVAASGAIAFADVDLLDSHSVTSQANGAGYLGVFSAVVADASTGDGEGSVAWDFSVDNAAIQYLAAGETLTQTYTVTVDDGNGGTVDQIVTVTLTGTNDAPTITSAVSTGVVTETADLSSGENVVTLSATGSIAFADIDVVDTHSATVTAQGSGYLGALTLGGVDQSGNVVGWTFSVNDADIDFLGAGETRTQNYTVAISDGQGGTVEQVVTITVNGTNDAPTVTSGAGQVFSFSDNVNSTQYDGTNASFQEAGFDFDGFYDYPYGYGVDNGGMAYTGGWNNWSTGGSDGTISRLDGANFGMSSFSARSYYSYNETATVNGYRDGVLVATQVINLSPTHQTFTLDAAFGNVDEVRFDAPQNNYIFLDEIVIGSTGTTVHLTELSDGDAGEGSATLSSSGTTAFFDVDLSDTHTATAAAQGSGYVGGLTIDGVDQDTNTVSWTFAVNDGEIDYLAAGETLTQTYTVTVDDGNGGTVDQTITVTITGTNDAPVATADTVVGVEDTSVTIDVLANDTDVDGEALTISHINGVNIGVNGTVSLGDGASVRLNADGTLTYTPAANANGLQSFSYTVSDGVGGTSTATVEVDLEPVNDAPVSQPDAASTDEDTALVLTATSLLANDTDVDGDSLSISSVSAVSARGASVSINAAGDVVYDPAGSAELQALGRGQQVTDTFTYVVTDPSGATSTATVTITVDGRLEAPVANPDTVTVSQNGQASGNVVANDDVTGSTDNSGNVLVNGSFEDGHSVGPGGIGYPASLPGWTSVQGSFEVWGTGFLGNIASDGTAFLELDNGGGQDAYSSNLTTDVGREYTLEFDLALRNGTSPASNQVEFLVNGVSLGVFTPPSTTFTTFTVTFIGSGSDVITFREPAGANDGVGGLIDNLRIAADADVFVTAVDGDAARVGAEVEGSNGGAFILQSDGSYTFDADGDFDHLGVGESATTSVTYTVTDDGGSSSTTLTVTVEGENDSPVASDDSIAAVEDQLVTFDVRSNDSDVDGDSLSVTHINGQAIAVGGTVALEDGGFLRLNPNGSLTYTPAANASGQVDFDYTVADGFGGVASASATIDVAGVADAPVLAVGSSTVLNPTVGSAIQTTVTLQAGDTVSFNWDFVAHDYMPYNDFAFASVNGAAYMLGSVQVVGDYGTTGWKTFTFTATEAGEYSFGVGVSNVNDSSLNSHLLVDNLQVNGVTISSFETGFTGWTTLGSVGVQTTHDGVSPTHGGQMAYLDSASLSASAIESFLGLAPGRLARIAEAAGQQGDEVTVPVSMTLGAGETLEDSYVIITGFPEGSTFNFGELEASGGWRVPASDLGGNLLINTPDDYSGSFTLTVVGSTYIDETGSLASTAPQTITVTIDPAPAAVAPEAASLAMTSKPGPEVSPLSDDDDAFVMPPVDDLTPLVLPGASGSELELEDLNAVDGPMTGNMFLTLSDDGQISFSDDPFAGHLSGGDLWQ